MGAVLNMRPDLFHAALAGAPPRALLLAACTWSGPSRACCLRSSSRAWADEHARNLGPLLSPPARARAGVPFVDCLTTMLDETIPLTTSAPPALCLCVRTP
jgi:hypothetical protein